MDSVTQVSVSPGAALLMDFHAHLSENEVVGLLAGTWNPQDRLLRYSPPLKTQYTKGSDGQ